MSETTRQMQTLEIENARLRLKLKELSIKLGGISQSSHVIGTCHGFVRGKRLYLIGPIPEACQTPEDQRMTVEVIIKAIDASRPT